LTENNEKNNLREKISIGEPLKLLIGGSPCTHWSIAQRKNRETKAEGIGWELFLNYVIAKEKWKPDIFLYENNESAADEIKNQISEELGYPLLHINSALVSAQQRKRIYCTNIPNVPQPSDRHIFLKDILEYGIVENENAYLLKHQSGNVVQTDNEPIRIGDIDTTAQAHRVYSPDGKSVNLTSNGGGQGAKTGLYMTPISITEDSFKHLTEKEMEYMVRTVAGGRNHFDFGYIQISNKDKSQCLLANLHKGVPYNVMCEEIQVIDLSKYEQIKWFENGNLSVDGKMIYLVKDGLIGYKDGLYPIKLNDGYYVIRKLTPLECERLQTLPDGYTAAPKNSATQRYKQIGNGWTAEVIIHILEQGLKDIQKDYPIEVLSLYDGIATGRYCLEKMGFTNIKYKAYEIDKYAINVATYNYPDIEECGDVFQVRNDDWVY
jgi:DNA (cytosine-5)-methyltransferase 3A